MDEHLLRFNKEKTLVFIDCETLNLCLNNCHNLPWQISMIKAKGDKKIDEKDYLIKWDTKLKISEDAARITRYSQSKVNKLGLKPEEIFPTIKDWLDNADHIVGHNILGFDIYLIKDLYELYGEDWSHLMPKILDTNCIAKGVKLGLPYDPESDFLAYQYRMCHVKKRGLKTRLGALGVEFNIEHDYDKLHDALVDLELNLKIWNKLKWQLEL
tara:strand:- start:21435 stop:22073 length:639 start_codon:yes stop_codon:yes gene_type:complete